MKTKEQIHYVEDSMLEEVNPLDKRVSAVEYHNKIYHFKDVLKNRIDKFIETINQNNQEELIKTNELIKSEVACIDSVLSYLNQVSFDLNLIKNKNPFTKNTLLSSLSFAEHRKDLINSIGKDYKTNLNIIQNNIETQKKQYSDYKMILQAIRRDIKVNIFENIQTE